MTCSSNFILHNKSDLFANLSPKKRCQLEHLSFQAYRASELIRQIDTLRPRAGSPWFQGTKPPSSTIPRK